MNPCFEYTETELDCLSKKDKALAKVIEEVGPIHRETIPDLFMALVHAIIGQQISMKAQKTVWERVQTALAPLTPEHLLSQPSEALRSCGLSERKALYIREIALAIVHDELKLDELHALNDDEVRTRLSSLRGIGIWTAEMLMIFSMQRKNILSRDDLAIQRGLRMLYRHRKITPAMFDRYRKRYSPYASLASLYLWALAGGACKGYTDPGERTHRAERSNRKKECHTSSLTTRLP